ncbi:hypothetical protein BKI52_05845 [marine bacterium AO1-C]|nr:hypothetical protein BKI52_05845 [marine bacterium AO1-C]
MKNRHSRYIKLVFTLAILIGWVGTSFSQYKFPKDNNESVIFDDRSIKQRLSEEHRLRQKNPLNHYLKNPAKAWLQEYQKLENELEATQKTNGRLKIYIWLSVLCNLLLASWWLTKKQSHKRNGFDVSK